MYSTSMRSATCTTCRGVRKVSFHNRDLRSIADASGSDKAEALPVISSGKDANGKGVVDDVQRVRQTQGQG
jgi:hypothetical protein